MTPIDLHRFAHRRNKNLEDTPITRLDFRYPLNPENLAHLLGVELEDVQRQLNQMAEELAPYLEYAADGAPHVTLEGIPILIRRMAFNIPTTDIIENLACQVLHLAAMHEDYALLEAEHAETLEKLEKLKGQLDALEQECRELREELTEIKTRGFWQKLGGLFRSEP